MSVEEIRLASKILSGDTDKMISKAADDDFEQLHMTDSEEDIPSEIELNRQNHQQKLNCLVYNESDEDIENEHCMVSKSKDNDRSAKNVSSTITVSHEGTRVFDINDSEYIQCRLNELEKSGTDSENETGNTSSNTMVAQKTFLFAFVDSHSEYPIQHSSGLTSQKTYCKFRVYLCVFINFYISGRLME